MASLHQRRGGLPSGHRAHRRRTKRTIKGLHPNYALFRLLRNLEERFNFRQGLVDGRRAQEGRVPLDLTRLCSCRRTRREAGEGVATLAERSHRF